MNERNESPWISIIALVIGAIGACGQGYLLYLELVDCLPYKEMDVMYESIARIGVWLAPLIAILIGTLFVRKRFWLSLVLPVISCPLLFAAVYKIFSVVNALVADPNAFGDFTTAKASQQFFSYCLSLIVTGFIIGAIVTLFLLFLTKPRKLA